MAEGASRRQGTLRRGGALSPSRAQRPLTAVLAAALACVCAGDSPSPSPTVGTVPPQSLSDGASAAIAVSSIVVLILIGVVVAQLVPPLRITSPLGHAPSPAAVGGGVAVSLNPIAALQKQQQQQPSSGALQQLDSGVARQHSVSALEQQQDARVARGERGAELAALAAATSAAAPSTTAVYAVTAAEAASAGAASSAGVVGGGSDTPAPPRALAPGWARYEDSEDTWYAHVDGRVSWDPVYA